MKQITIALIACLFLGAQVGYSQLQTPAPSPQCKMTQTVGLTDITIEYSRPGVKDRTIFGDLVPYDVMWRTGANASTKVTFSEDVKVNGYDLAKGTYALYTIPGKDLWTIIFHTNLSYWGTGGDDYKTEEDAIRFTVEPHMMDTWKAETMTIGVDNISNNAAKMYFVWETTYLEFPVEVNTVEQVSTQIDNVMAGPSARDYYSSARYYYDEEMDLAKAYKWVNTAIGMDYEKYWSVGLKARIEAAMGDFDSAVTSAGHSAKLAEDAGNTNWVKIMNDSAAEWSEK